MSTAVRQVAKGYLKFEGKNGVWDPPPPVGSRGKTPGGALGAFAPEADNASTLVVKMCYFVAVLSCKNDSDICIQKFHSYKFHTRWKKNQFGDRKVVQLVTVFAH